MGFSPSSVPRVDALIDPRVSADSFHPIATEGARSAPSRRPSTSTPTVFPSFPSSDSSVSTPQKTYMIYRYSRERRSVFKPKLDGIVGTNSAPTGTRGSRQFKIKCSIFEIGTPGTADGLARIFSLFITDLINFSRFLNDIFKIHILKL